MRSIPQARHETGCLTIDFDAGIRETILVSDHPDWWQRLKTLKILIIATVCGSAMSQRMVALVLSET